jgi:hypothetical protein
MHAKSTEHTAEDLVLVDLPKDECAGCAPSATAFAWSTTAIGRQRIVPALPNWVAITSLANVSSRRCSGPGRPSPRPAG